ncbi:MAG: stage II sporulation protein M [Dehalogenimonas sp.]|uniref:Stage II sporulation protein M n=1 Tax=Candidatus Dehalogenimonas loeffleri TaxID=3127115 RepID=A0ABZ2J3T5_9CHLR|nr:stage II sporulation protein M [Dehalogenimonas sp.]
MTFTRWLYIAGSVFVTGMFIGSLLPAGAIAEELSIFDELAGETQSLSGAGLLVFILLNNVTAFMMAFLVAPLLLLLPLASLFLNGAVITLVSRLVLEDQSIGFLMAGLLPHGVIEIPAYILAMAASLSFGFAVLRGLFRPAYRPQVLPEFKTNLRRLGIALTLLVPAALIESFITPLFIGWFG